MDNTEQDVISLLGLLQKGDLEGFSAKITQSEDQLNRRDINGFTLLHHAADLDEHKIFDLLLKHPKVLTDAKTDKGLTCLHLAASNSFRTTQLILETKKDLIEISNNWKETPLHLAVAANQTEIVELLIQHGANVNARDSWNRTPLMIISEYIASQNQDHPIYNILKEKSDPTSHNEKSEVSEHGQNTATSMMSEALIQDFMKIVQDRKTDFDLSKIKVKSVIDFEKKNETILQREEIIVDDKRVPLSKKIEFPGSVPEVKKLLENPTISAHGTDMFGLTALHKFASWGNVELTELILTKLDEHHINILSTSEGFTALHWAIEMCQDLVVDCLLNDGRINIEKKNKENKTAFEMAKQQGNDDIVKVFQKYFPNLD